MRSSGSAAAAGELETVLQLGQRWSVRRIERLLAALRRQGDPSARVTYVLRRLLRDGAPFERESDLPPVPDHALRVRFESFDCATFVYVVLALQNARSFDDFVRRLAYARYRGPVHPRNLIHYTGNVLARLETAGWLREITADLVPRKVLAERTVTLGVLASGAYFVQSPYGMCGDENVGRPLRARYIPTEHVASIESALSGGDLIVLISAKGPGEYPDVVGHVAFVHKPPRSDRAYVLHCGMSFVGSRDGRRAGVSLLRYRDWERQALYASGALRPLHRYLRDHPDLWCGARIFRCL